MRLKNILIVVKDIDGMLKKLDESPYEIEYINRAFRHSWGQRDIRIYDQDGHMIEIGEPVYGNKEEMLI